MMYLLATAALLAVTLYVLFFYFFIHAHLRSFSWYKEYEAIYNKIKKAKDFTELNNVHQQYLQFTNMPTSLWEKKKCTLHLVKQFKRKYKSFKTYHPIKSFTLSIN